MFDYIGKLVDEGNTYGAAGIIILWEFFILGIIGLGFIVI